jgi:hypothetical protein
MSNARLSATIMFVGAFLPLTFTSSGQVELSSGLAEVSIAAEPGNCAVPRSVLELGRSAQLAVAIETVAGECWGHVDSSPRIRRITDFKLQSVIDAIQLLDDRYEVKIIGRTIVSRPKDASKNGADFLTRQVPPFQSTLNTLGAALDSLSLALESRRFVPGASTEMLRVWQPAFQLMPSRNTPRGVDPMLLLGWPGQVRTEPWEIIFPGGALVDALNSMISSSHGGGWILTYCATEGGEAHAILLMILRDLAVGTVQLVSLSPSIPQSCVR